MRRTILKLIFFFDWEPMEGVEDRGDVITELGVREQADCRVLNQLKSMEGARRNAGEDRVIIIQTGDQGVDEGLSSMGRDGV